MEAVGLVDRAGCPDRQTLIQFSLGNLPPTVLEGLTNHVLLCRQCCVVLDDLRLESNEESLVAALKSGCPCPTPFEEAAWERLAAAARVLGPEAATLPTTEVNPEANGRGREEFVPREVGPYLLLDWIGEGGMGVVYRARQQTLNRDVALKMILAGRHASPQAVARFHNEGEALARVPHPNIVEIYDFGEHDGLPYFTMELVEGGTLGGRLAGGPLPPREVAELVRTLAEAVESAHRKGVLHRDLKPANVLLTATGVPKLTDFGLAKLLDPEKTPSLSGVVMGTPEYMAPEQADGRTSAIGPRTDVYGLGAILYAALTGRAPFKGETPAKTYDLVRKALPVPPTRMCRSVPWQLEEICLKCLEKEPGQRYPTAQALADDLDSWLHDKRPPGLPRWPQRALRALRRRPAAVGTGLAVLVLLVAAATVAYLRDPKRPLRELEGKLDHKLPVTLIGEQGPPAYYSIRSGDESTKVSISADGSFSVHSWSVCLLELLPDPRRQGYRFRVRVRHENSDMPGVVGIYFAHRAFPGPINEYHLFGGMTYNDIRSAKDYVERFPPDVAAKLNAPRENHVHLGVGVTGEHQRGVPWEYLPAVCAGAPFLPRNENNRTWRDLEVVVSPEGVIGTRDGQAVGFLSAADARRNLGNIVNVAAKRNPDNPFLKGIDPSYSPGGGLGLLVYRGAASFQSAVVTPLPGGAEPGK